MVKKRNLQAWVDVKKRCRLDDADIKMAKELGMTPNSIIKNIPTAKQQWKLPVKEWIHYLYEEKFNKVLTVYNKNDKGQETPSNFKQWINDEDLPF